MVLLACPPALWNLGALACVLWDRGEEGVRLSAVRARCALCHHGRGNPGALPQCSDTRQAEGSLSRVELSPCMVRRVVVAVSWYGTVGLVPRTVATVILPSAWPVFCVLKSSRWALHFPLAQG